MKDRLIFRISAGLVALGLLLIVAAYLQPAVPATVVSRTHMTHTPRQGRTGARYHATLEVEYTDSQGKDASATLEMTTANQHDIPQAGDRIEISRGPAGMVVHPWRFPIGVGSSCVCIGGLVIAGMAVARLIRPPVGRKTK